MSVTVKCPSCQSILDAPEALDGLEVECPVCKKLFVVQLPKPAAPPPAPVPPPAQQAAPPKLRLRAPVPPLPPSGPGFGPTQNFRTPPPEPRQTGASPCALLALLIAIVALLLALFYEQTPQLKLKKEPTEAVIAYKKFQFQELARKDPFWQLAEKKIQESLHVDDVDKNGRWAIAFYTYSYKTKTTKETMLLFLTEDAYWIPITDPAQDRWAKKYMDEEWLQRMQEKKRDYCKDSCKLDDFDI